MFYVMTARCMACNKLFTAGVEFGTVVPCLCYACGLQEVASRDEDLTLPGGPSATVDTTSGKQLLIDMLTDPDQADQNALGGMTSAT